MIKDPSLHLPDIQAQTDLETTSANGVTQPSEIGAHDDQVQYGTLEPQAGHKFAIKSHFTNHHQLKQFSSLDHPSSNNLHKSKIIENELKQAQIRKSYLKSRFKNSKLSSSKLLKYNPNQVYAQELKPLQFRKSLGHVGSKKQKSPYTLSKYITNGNKKADTAFLDTCQSSGCVHEENQSGCLNLEINNQESQLNSSIDFNLSQNQNKINPTMTSPAINKKAVLLKSQVNFCDANVYSGQYGPTMKPSLYLQKSKNKLLKSVTNSPQELIFKEISSNEIETPQNEVKNKIIQKHDKEIAYPYLSQSSQLMKKFQGRLKQKNISDQAKQIIQSWNSNIVCIQPEFQTMNNQNSYSNSRTALMKKRVVSQGSENQLRSISTEPFYRSHYNETGAGTSKFIGGGFYPKESFPQTTTSWKTNQDLNTIDGTHSKQRIIDINYQSHSLQSRSSVVTFHPDSLQPKVSIKQMNQKFSELMKFNLTNEFQKMDQKILKIEHINTAFSSRKQSNSNRDNDSQAGEQSKVKKDSKNQEKEKKLGKFGLKVRFSKDDREVII